MPVRYANNSTTVESCTIIAIIEGRGNDRGVIGMASMDLRFMEISLFQFVDTSAYTLLKTNIQILDPVEIVMPDSSSDKQGSDKFLNQAISKMFTDIEIQTIQRRHFNEKLGSELVRRCMSEEVSNIDNVIFKKAYAMGAVFALVKYVEMVQNIVFNANSLKILYESLEDSCLIDVTSWENLELFNRRPAKKNARWRCLYERMNKCVTNGGSRTLRSCLLQPSANVTEINDRLDMVEELMQNQATLEKIRAWLSAVQDLQRVITVCVFVDNNTMKDTAESKRAIRSKITHVLSIRSLLDTVFSLHSTLFNMRSPIVLKNLQKITDPRLKEVAKLISERFDENAVVKKQRGSLGARDAILDAVRNDQNVILQLSRQAHTELTHQIASLAQSDGLTEIGATLSYTYGRGYHYSIKNKLAKNLPAICIQTVRNRLTTTFTTLNMIKYNDRLAQLETEILLKSDMVVNQLLLEIRPYVPALHNCVEFVSVLDFLTTITCYSLNITDGVRPRFGTQLAIKAGRHPLLDEETIDIVPNETFVSTDTRFVLITGPNMAGKSTYIKQVCLLQILAQIGCYVPARSACFVPRKHIYSRIGHNDDLGDNLSSFALEMAEISSMLQSANENSLIIIDELARSTSTEEGLSICFAICEKLIESKAIVFLATHFLDLCLLETHYTVVRNFHFSASIGVDNDNNEFLLPSHLLEAGPYRGPLYGLELAELTSLPQTILDSARAMATRLRADVEQQRMKGSGIGRQRELCQLAHRILHLIDRIPTTTEQNLGNYLVFLQEKFANNLKINS